MITIDGQAGTGKSTAADRLANRLGFQLLNTGAMYRAVGYVLLRANFDIHAEHPDTTTIAETIANWTFNMPEGRVMLNGEDLAEAIHGETIGAAASKAGTILEVRRKLQAEQRRLADGLNIVCEGRDQGTVVFPHAELKFYMTASVDVRTDRRLAQMMLQQLPVDREVIRQQILDRDWQDENRVLDPLKQADDAHIIDATTMTLDDVLVHMLEIVHQCRS